MKDGTIVLNKQFNNLKLIQEVKLERPFNFQGSVSCIREAVMEPPYGRRLLGNVSPVSRAKQQERP
jgi:hypothetical protein